MSIEEVTKLDGGPVSMMSNLPIAHMSIVGVTRLDVGQAHAISRLSIHVGAANNGKSAQKQT